MLFIHRSIQFVRIIGAAQIVHHHELCIFQRDSHVLQVIMAAPAIVVVDSLQLHTCHNE